MKQYIYKIFAGCLLACCMLISFNSHAQLLGGENADDLYNEAVKQTNLKNYSKAIELAKEGINKRPNFVDMYVLLAKLYVTTSQYDNARTAAKEALLRDPRYRDAYFYAINVEMATHHYDDALCYADEALYMYPYDKEFMLKRLAVLDEGRNIYASSEYAERLINHYAEDRQVVTAYVGHEIELGRYYLNRGNLMLASFHFEKALSVDPTNNEALSYIFNAYVRSGNYEEALAKINSALVISPKSYELLMRKLNILQQMSKYVEALDILQKLTVYYPNDAKIKGLDVEMRMEAGRYFANSDPYIIFESVLAKNPGNQEALNKIISLSVLRGAYREALNWVNQSLKTNPTSPIMLGQKVQLLTYMQNYVEAADIAEKLWEGNPGNVAYRAQMIELKLASGKYYMGQQQNDLAIEEFQKILTIDPTNLDALNSLANVLIATKKYDDAISVLDRAVAANPNSNTLLLKKSSVLSEAGRFDEAAEIAQQLVAKDPSNTKYLANLIDLRLSAGRGLMKQEEYDQARRELVVVLDQDPDNLEALNYMINLESGVQNYENALIIADQALKYYPDDKDLLLKKASILQELKRFPESATIASQLAVRYPYNSKYRAAYIDAVIASGRNFQQTDQLDSALTEYKKVLKISPRDTLALYYSVGVLNQQGKYDSVLAVVSQGLKYYPNNTFFQAQRTTALEKKEMYAQASLSADSLVKLSPTKDYMNYANYLKSRALTNQFGLFFLNSTYNNPLANDTHYNIGTVEYRKFTNYGSWAGRMNYAGRQQGTGLQGEAELYYNHKSKIPFAKPIGYSYAVAAVANDVVFPKLRLGYSFFKTIGNDYEGELGLRYVIPPTNPVSNKNSISLVASAGKIFNDFYVNLRGYLISEEKLYQSYNLNTRYYMNNEQDYVSFNAGIGTSPDDKSRLVQFPQLLGVTTRSFGAGYQKVINFRNTIGINGTLINQKISTNTFQNQYDVYLTFMRKF